MPTTASKRDPSQSSTSACGIDEELDAFVDEFLKINFKKQRAESAKFAKELKEHIDQAEGTAMAQVTSTGRSLNKLLPTVDQDAKASGDSLEQTLDAVVSVLDDVLIAMKTSLTEYQVFLEQALTDECGARKPGERDSTSAVSRGRRQITTEHLQELETGLGERPRRLAQQAFKLVKKHQNEQQKRAERKEIGVSARELVRQCAGPSKK